MDFVTYKTTRTTTDGKHYIITVVKEGGMWAYLYIKRYSICSLFTTQVHFQRFTYEHEALEEAESIANQFPSHAVFKS